MILSHLFEVVCRQHGVQGPHDDQKWRLYLVLQYAGGFEHGQVSAVEAYVTLLGIKNDNEQYLFKND